MIFALFALFFLLILFVVNYMFVWRRKPAVVDEDEIDNPPAAIYPTEPVRFYDPHPVVAVGPTVINSPAVMRTEDAPGVDLRDRIAADSGSDDEPIFIDNSPQPFQGDGGSGGGGGATASWTSDPEPTSAPTPDPDPPRYDPAPSYDPPSYDSSSSYDSGSSFSSDT